jgi:heme-degrading monooxygenase HmoA
VIGLRLQRRRRGEQLARGAAQVAHRQRDFGLGDHAAGPGALLVRAEAERRAAQQLARPQVLAQLRHGDAAQGQRRRVVAQRHALERTERVARCERAGRRGDQGIHGARLHGRPAGAGAARRLRTSPTGDTMVIELADIRVRPEDKAAFSEAITRALKTVLSKAAGYRGHTVYACQETPGRYMLKVEWDSVEAHNVGFRQSPAFAEWRAIIGPFFAQPPVVEHFDVVTTS